MESYRSFINAELLNLNKYFQTQTKDYLNKQVLENLSNCLTVS